MFGEKSLFVMAVPRSFTVDACGEAKCKNVCNFIADATGN
jgi:hypothetical protein